MKDSLVIFHGSKDIVERPLFGVGKKHNDFGLGFYCTEDEELAKEWSVSSSKDGYVNAYVLDARYLNVLHLSDSQYTILNWIAVLVEHRLFPIESPNARRAEEYLSKHFGINVNAYDLIVGYRADDSYFDYAYAFLNNAITVEQLALAMRLGKLGEQIVLKSEAAFSQIRFLESKHVSREPYYQKRVERNEQANRRYQALLEKGNDGLFIQDIIRGGIQNDDPRIPRNEMR